MGIKRYVDGLYRTTESHTDLPDYGLVRIVFVRYTSYFIPGVDDTSQIHTHLIIDTHQEGIDTWREESYFVARVDHISGVSLYDSMVLYPIMPKRTGYVEIFRVHHLRHAIMRVWE